MANTKTLSSITTQNTVTVNESNTIGADPTLASLPGVVSAGQQWRFDGTIGPAVTKVWHRQVTLVAGAATLDLTALTDDILTTQDMTGLKLKALHAVPASTNANAITIKPGAANGYTGWVGTDGIVLNTTTISSVNYPDNVFIGPLYGGIAVDGTHKNIDIAGTGTQKVNLILMFG